MEPLLIKQRAEKVHHLIFYLSISEGLRHHANLAGSLQLTSGNVCSWRMADPETAEANGRLPRILSSSARRVSATGAAGMVRTTGRRPQLQPFVPRCPAQPPPRSLLPIPASRGLAARIRCTAVQIDAALSGLQGGCGSVARASASRTRQEEIEFCGGAVGQIARLSPPCRSAMITPM